MPSSIGDALRTALLGHRFDPLDAAPQIYDDLVVRTGQADYRNGTFAGFRFDVGIRRDPTADLEVRFKHVSLLRLSRIAPIEIQRADEGLTLTDAHRDLLNAMHKAGAFPITVVANDPASVGLMFCPGVQAAGPTPAAAAAAAQQALDQMRALYIGEYRQVKINPLTAEEAHWLGLRMATWRSLAVCRGIPQPRREASSGMLNPISGVTEESSVQQQIEQFCRALADREFLFVVAASPLSQQSVNTLLQQVSRQLELVRSDIEISRTHSAGVSMPILFGGSAGGTQGLSHGVSAGQAHSQSQAQGHNVSDTVGHSLTDSHGTSQSQSQSVTQGQSVGSSLGQSHQASLSHADGQQLSVSHGQSVGQSTSQSQSHTVGASESTGVSHGQTDTSGVSQTEGTSHSTSYSDGTSTSNSAGISGSASHSLSQNVGRSESAGSSADTHAGLSSSTGENAKAGFDPLGVGGGGGLSHANGTSSGIGSGVSASHGASQGVSASSSTSAGYSDSLSVGSSQSFGESTGTSLSQGVSHSVADSASLSQSHGLSASEGQTTGSSTSAQQSLSTSQGASQTVTGSQGGSVSLGQNASQSASEGQSVGSSVSQSVAQGASQSQSVGASTTDTTGATQSLADNTGNSVGASWGATGSMALAPSVSLSVQKKMFDEYKRVLATILQTQSNRLVMARQEEAWQTYCWLLTPDPQAKRVAAAAAVQAFWGPAQSGDLPVRFHTLTDLPPEEEDHLLVHARSFSGCLVREPSPRALERHAYSTLLTSTELAVMTHPPRIDLPGIQVQFDPVPTFRVPVNHSGDIPLGYAHNPERDEVTRYRYGFNGNQLTHSLVVGASGSGKTVSAENVFVNFVNRPAPTVTVRDANGYACEQKIPYGALVLDWKRSWRGIIDHVDRSRFRFASLWDPAMGFKYNLLEVPDGVPPSVHLDSLCEALALSMGLGQRGRGLLRQATMNLYRREMNLRYIDPAAAVGATSNVMKTPQLSRLVGMAELYTEISNMYDDALKNKQTGNSLREGLQVVQMRLQHFAPGEELSKIYTRDVCDAEMQDHPEIQYRFDAGEFAREGCLRLADLIGPGLIVVLEGGPLDPTVKKAICTALATSVFVWARIKGDGAFSPERLIVLEEAHEVLVSGQSSTAEIGGISATIWEEMWNEGRSLGLRLMAIAQIPEVLPGSVVANSSTKIIHKLETVKDQQIAMVAIGKDARVDHRPYQRFIGNLPPGFCIVRSHGSGSYEDADPVLVHPDLLKHSAPSDESLRHYSIRRQPR